MNIAKEALSLMPKNSIALTLVGMVMAQSPETKDKVLTVMLHIIYRNAFFLCVRFFFSMV